MHKKGRACHMGTPFNKIPHNAMQCNIMHASYFLIAKESVLSQLINPDDPSKLGGLCVAFSPAVEYDKISNFLKLG